MTDRLYVTTPIYYVNDKPHIGHAYCTVLADAARRYGRLCGAETYFVTGTDEHGQKVEQAAAKRGVEPQQHCDELHLKFKLLWPELHCDPDQFIRTTEPRHKAVVQRALQQLWDEGLIVPREFEGWYCTVCERFWTEKDLVAADPELQTEVGGRCKDCGRPVTRLVEKNYFFLMSRYQQALIEAIERKEIEILPPGRANEVLGFLREPLQDLCISRPKERLRWGIDLPFDPEYVTYVWFDALLNYVTAVGGLFAAEPGGDARPAPAEGEATAFETWWPAVTHFLGKDILTTHAVYWPTMLMALRLPVPKRLVATGWWLIDDTKMSKSLGNVVDPLSLKDKYGAEVLRYFLLREMAVGQDANFSEAALVRRNNSDLANDLGNLVQRVVALAARSFDGKVPTPRHRTDAGQGLAVDGALHLGRLLAGRRDPGTDTGDVQPLRDSVATVKLHRAIADTMLLVQRLNLALTVDAPFKTVRTEPQLAADTLYHVLEGIRFAANMLEPVLPETALRIFERIGWTRGVLPLDQLQWGELEPGAPLREGEPLFPKHVFESPQVAPADAARTGEQPALRKPAPAQVQAQADQPQSPPAPPAAVEAVDIDTFARVDLRVGRVLAAEPVPKSKKLLRLQIDLGEGQPRQILSGIAETVAPADLLDRQVLVVANLPPRMMMGMESHGMLLVAEDERGARVPLSPSRAVPAGAQVK